MQMRENDLQETFTYYYYIDYFDFSFIKMISKMANYYKIVMKSTFYHCYAHKFPLFNVYLWKWHVLNVYHWIDTFP